MAHQPSKSSDIAQEWPESSKNQPKPIAPSEPSSQEIDVDDLDEWNTTSCLFCPAVSNSFSINMSHMTDMHNLSIPSEDRLAVDLQTLLSYCHLVISGYLECLSCGTQRNSVKPLQAHMRDKKHCGFSIQDEDSEFRAFYSVEDEGGDGYNDGENEDGESGSEKRRQGDGSRIEKLVQVEAGWVRLSTGKILSNKAYRSPRPAKASTSPEMLQDTLNPSSSSPPASTTPSTSSLNHPILSTALSRADKRNLTASQQLSHLRAADRMQLAHLPASEQRAILATQKKQVEKERRAQQWMQGRIERKGNKTLMMNFKIDVPGRLNG